MIERASTMIQHTHREHRVKPVQVFRDVFHPDGQQADICSLQVFLQGLKLEIE
jgi:hypothetical protein